MNYEQNLILFKERSKRWGTQKMCAHSCLTDNESGASLPIWGTARDVLKSFRSLDEGDSICFYTPVLERDAKFQGAFVLDSKGTAYVREREVFFESNPVDISKLAYGTLAGHGNHPPRQGKTSFDFFTVANYDHSAVAHTIFHDCLAEGYTEPASHPYEIINNYSLWLHIDFSQNGGAIDFHIPENDSFFFLNTDELGGFLDDVFEDNLFSEDLREGVLLQPRSFAMRFHNSAQLGMILDNVTVFPPKGNLIESHVTYDRDATA